MAQVDDVFFGKGKREQFFKMKTEGVRKSLLWAPLLLVYGAGRGGETAAVPPRPPTSGAECPLRDRTQRHSSTVRN
eukprot:COSAG02_NODE_1999_length_10148_cov_15.105483_1_plen_76_part_00